MIKWNEKETKLVDTSFSIMLYLKTLFAVGQVVAGVLLYYFKPTQIKHLLFLLTEGEVHGGIHGFISAHFLKISSYINDSASHLAAIYLLIHGGIKLVALILLHKEKLFAYPLSILVFVGFIIFQLREYFSSYSILMIFLCVFDVIMIILTWLEYQKMKLNFSKR